MYRVKNKPFLSDAILFERGGKRLKIRTACSVDTIIASLDRERAAFAAANNALSANFCAETVRGYTDAACSLMALILGRENVDALVKFYGDNIIELMRDITPYITERVVPKIRGAARDEVNRAKKERT